jgi:drug/metabolite transporter (DMT)-like permease
VSGEGPAGADDLRRWLRVAPAVFVLIWATGFVVARYGMPHAPPLGFLALRFALSALAFWTWIRLAGVAWPQGRVQWGWLALAGVLMHAGYLGGVWVAVKLGLGAGLAALIVGLQPLLTALWMSRAAQGAVPGRAWIGLGLGMLGLVLVVQHKLGAGEAAPANVAAAVLALLAITAGTLVQKRWVAPCDARSANAVQLLGALAAMLPLALLEAVFASPGVGSAGTWSAGWRWNAELLGALAWSVLVLTLLGSSLLVGLIQRGAATQVTSLLYLVPPTTALMAFVLFGEALGPGVLAGFALSAAGVALVVRSPAR